MALRYLILSTLLFTSAIFLAQVEDPNTTTFSRLNGLPPMKIDWMASDSSGQLWIGSNTGLHRFDGKHFVTYNSLPKVEISDIEVGWDGTVYVALVSEGLAIYDQSRDDFNLLRQNEIFKKGKGRYLDILESSNGDLFLSQNGTGVHRLKKEEGRIETVFKKRYIESILEFPDVENKLILFGDSIEILDLETKQLTLIDESPSLSAIMDSNGMLWYTTDEQNGLYRFDLKNSYKSFYVWDALGPMFANGLTFLKGEIWIAADHGIRVFDPSDGKFRDYYKELGQVTSIMTDPLNRIWFGQDNALKVIDPYNQFFRFIEESQGKTYTAIAEIGRDRFFLAPFLGSHFELLDLPSGGITKIELPERYKDFEYPFDLALQDRKVYIAYNNGILTFDLDSQQIKEAKIDKYKDLITENTKKNLYAGKDGVLWISAFGRGVLFKYDTRKMSIDSMNFPSLDGVFSQEIRILESGEIVQPTEIGVHFIDFDSKSHKLFRFERDEEFVNLPYIEDIQINQKEVWILSGSRIFIADLEEGKIKIKKDVDNSDVFNFSLGISIESGKDKDKIILTSSGISIYNSELEAIASFGIDEGLVNVDRRTRLRKFGDQYFFLSDGISYLNQRDLSFTQNKSSVEITKMVVNGVNVLGSSKYAFSNSSNDIKIEFKSIDLTKPLDVKYKYRISKENPWVYTNYDATEVLLWDLKAGNYEFEVSAKHLYSDWSSPEVLNFKIRQAIWKRWWFILVSILLLLTIAYFYYNRQLNRAKELADLKTRMAELENEALRAQMNPHFIFNSLNSIKSYIIENEKEAAADYLTDFSDLIRLILANSREKYIALERELEALQLYMDIENIRLEGKFSYEINNTVSNALIQPLTLQPFIENAIWHGFVHKKENGILKIEISKHEDRIKITIEDDGVGRSKSKLIEQKHRRKRSYGILITKERLAQTNLENEIRIEDLYHENGEACGTRVHLSIPYINSK